MLCVPAPTVMENDESDGKIEDHERFNDFALRWFQAADATNRQTDRQTHLLAKTYKCMYICICMYGSPITDITYIHLLCMYSYMYVSYAYLYVSYHM